MSSSLFPGRRVLWTPLSIGWRPPSAEAAFCCEAMASALAFDCNQHADPFECADHLVVYNEVFDEFGIVVHDGGPSYVLIAHCPWCGTRGPCITSPYQMEPANSAGKLRRSSGSLAEPLQRDSPCCCKAGSRVRSLPS